ncbi:hypothetical protein FKM82_022028 [Ascaphus truei]
MNRICVSLGAHISVTGCSRYSTMYQVCNCYRMTQLYAKSPLLNQEPNAHLLYFNIYTYTMVVGTMQTQKRCKIMECDSKKRNVIPSL